MVESDGDLVAENAKYLTAEVLLRLVSERHPGKNLVGYAASNLPILPSYYVEGVRQGGAPPVYMQVVAPKNTFLPTIQTPIPTTTTTTTTQPVINPSVPVRENLFISKQIFKHCIFVIVSCKLDTYFCFIIDFQL